MKTYYCVLLSRLLFFFFEGNVEVTSLPIAAPGFLQSRYRRKCPFPSCIIKEMKVDRGHLRYITHRDTYNWGWTTTVVTNSTRHQVQEPPLAAGEFMYPSSCYEELLPISKEKYRDLQELKVFCNSEAQEYYSNITFRL
ncbi:uncharacterized protein [Periplaneta americana]|uniref:uncharacterized protein isoform X1 n=1 Tax=Periplaneta americana TaxID=6978 RepID=UPI0037E73BDE